MSTPTRLALAALLVGARTARRHYRDWGATEAERRARLPGDELVPAPAGVTTMAVSVHALHHDVWPWLLQMGMDHNADEVHSEWQTLAVGDRVTLVPPGWGPLRDGYSLPVALVLPGRALVLRQSPPEHPWDGVWSLHLLPDGECRTRLVSRGRTHQQAGLAGAGQRVADELMRPVITLMTRRMLLGIKERAERSARPFVAVA